MCAHPFWATLPWPKHDMKTLTDQELSDIALMKIMSGLHISDLFAFAGQESYTVPEINVTISHSGLRLSA